MAAASLSLVSCLVTDSIEFEDALNHPPEIIESKPTTAVINVCKEQEPQPGFVKYFEVTVWDPDIEQLEEIPIQAKIFVYNYQNKPEQNAFCSIVDKQQDTEEYPEGALIFFSCEIDLGPKVINGIADDTLVPVIVQVSDSGFTSSDTIREGGRTAEQVWVLHVKADYCDS